MTDDVSESLQGPRFTFEEYQCQIAEVITSMTGPLRDALKEGKDIVEGAVTHVTHGGPSITDALAWIKKAEELLKS